MSQMGHPLSRSGMSATDSSRTRRRRHTQVQPRAETRRRLLDATIQSSRGRLWHHAPLADLAGVSQGDKRLTSPAAWISSLSRRTARRPTRRRAPRARHTVAGRDRRATRGDHRPALGRLLELDVHRVRELRVVAADDPQPYARLVTVEHQIACATGQLTLRANRRARRAAPLEADSAAGPRRTARTRADRAVRTARTKPPSLVAGDPRRAVNVLSA